MVSFQILVASAKTFEEFVDEQLQEDGSGQVLRRAGGTGLLVPRLKSLSQAFIVAPGCCLCWEFRVKVRTLLLYCCNTVRLVKSRARDIEMQAISTCHGCVGKT